MNDTQKQNTFYFKMGMLLVVLVIAGFGSIMFKEDRSPFDLPFLFHIHAAVYISWFLLFILQTKLISNHNYNLHKKLGYSSIALVIGMLVTSFLMSATSYSRGTSPIPDTTIQQFMSLPLLDLVGLIVFYTLGVFNRSKAILHKHCMLICSIAIMDPALARFTLSLGVPPLAVLFHIGLIALVMTYDKRNAGTINVITWLGLAFVVLRSVFFFTVAGTESWASLMDAIYG